jgi:ABC-type amino acid transport substrate-binding protein
MGLTAMRQSFFNTILLGILLASASFSANSQTPLRILAYIEPPFMDTDGVSRKGIAIDIAEELFRRVEFAFEIVFVPPKRAYIFATTTPGNCVIAIERSQDREAKLQWIGPFLMTRHAFYRMTDSPNHIRSLEDATPYRIGTFLGSGSSEYLESMGIEVDQAPSNDLNLRKLELGRIDLWASDTVSASVLIKENNANIVMERVFLTTLREMACHPSTDPAIIKALQAGLQSMYQDGTISRLYARYLGPGVKWLDIN